MSPVCRYALGVIALCAWSVPGRAESALDQALSTAAPAADPQVIRLAVQAAACAVAQGQQAAHRLAVIDYSRASTQPRLWVFDLVRRRLLYTELVAHGRNSGDNYAQSFSNTLGSFESSLGLFRTGDSYDGRNGYSLRLEGLEEGFNDRAGERAIVMHGAPYVNTRFLRTQGRLGRSEGCPAVRPEIAKPLINTLKDGQFLFAYYPDPKWLASSRYLQCGRQPLLVAGERASPHAADAGMLSAAVP